jgi:hypothetical protein
LVVKRQKKQIIYLNTQLDSLTIRVDDLTQEVIDDVEATVGEITESFLGSDVFNRLATKYAVTYNLTTALFAEILISRRKQLSRKKATK